MGRRPSGEIEAPPALTLKKNKGELDEIRRYGDIRSL